MQNFGFLRRLMTLGERQALLELLPFVDYASESSRILIEMLMKRKTGISELNEQIRTSEKKGDDLTMAISGEVTQGAINATLLGHLLTLTETFDDLLDKSLYISREVKRVDHIRDSFDKPSDELVEQCYRKFAEMLEANIEALSLLRKILNAKKLDTMRKIRKDIERIEEKVDDIKDNLIDLVYNHWNEINYVVFNHLTGLAHKIDDLLDDCEDISDLVMTVVSSMAK